MKFPSIQTLVAGFISVVRRFPLEMLSAVTGTTTAMIMAEENLEGVDRLVRLLFCSNLGLVLFLSFTVLGESKSFPAKSRVVLRLFGGLLLFLIYFLLEPVDQDTTAFRFGFLFVAFHLLVSFAPFLYRGSVEGFWEYNKQLFLRILTAGLYSSVLYAGLAVALVSTDALFDFDIRDEIYQHLLFLVFGIFNTSFFLAGVPAKWEALEERQLYPKGLKIFTQYVLIPLATIYLGILIAYEGKLIAEWTLPKGLVSSLVLGYAVYGILSILLVHPIRFDQGNRWMRTFSRLFYLLLIPLIVLLVIAVWTRVHQYGITESRYILIVLSFWLTGITIYFLSSRLQNMKVIPVSLCLLSLLSAWGPQSASSVSRQSQIKRLIAFFEGRNSVNGDKLLPLGDPAGSGDATELLRFIIDRYGIKALQDHVTINLDSLVQAADTIKANHSRNYQRVESVRNYLNLHYDYDTPELKYFSAATGLADSLSIEGFRYLIEVSYPYQVPDSVYSWHTDSTLVSVRWKGKQNTFDLMPVFNSVRQKADRESRYAQYRLGELYCEGAAAGTRLVIRELYFREENEKLTVQNLKGLILVR
jgi:hypothetical protein